MLWLLLATVGTGLESKVRIGTLVLHADKVSSVKSANTLFFMVSPFWN